MNLSELQSLFAKAGAVRLFAKPLAENDNSKNQIFFAGAVEALTVFPSRQIYAAKTKKGPTFKAQLDFGWLLPSGTVAPAPHAQLILYAQYPEVRFSGFLLRCPAAPSALMAPRPKGRKRTLAEKAIFVGRVLFLGVTLDRRVIGVVVAGNSEIAAEFHASAFPRALSVFSELSLPHIATPGIARSRLLTELGRIHNLGWIDSKQLSSDHRILPCTAPQCGGFTLEAELGIAKNSSSEPDFLGWEIKQHGVSNLERIEAGTITLLTPEPNGGFYKDFGVELFVRKFGYADKNGREDRLNFGGIHKVGVRQPNTGLTMRLPGFDFNTGKISDANGCLALVSDEDEIAASWAFTGLLEHWSRKHSKAAYVPSICRKEPSRQYKYGDKVRLAEGTDSLKLLGALATGAAYYDPGIKLENASTSPRTKRRSQFRIASKNIADLYDNVRIEEVPKAND